MHSRRVHRGPAAAAALLAAGLALGCTRGAKTPQEAYDQFAVAVRARDPARLFAALDLDTRWGWMSMRRAHREAYDIVLSNYPEGPEREQLIRRFEAGALAESETALFAAAMNEARFAELARGLPDAAAPVASGDEAQVATTDGRSLRFHRGKNGRWGFGGMAAEADQMTRRAYADLEQVRASAADYERAATRSGK